MLKKTLLQAVLLAACLAGPATASAHVTLQLTTTQASPTVGTSVTARVRINGTVPAGAQLAIRASVRGGSGRVIARRGRSTTATLTSSVPGTVDYYIVLVSRGKRTLARSSSLAIAWAAAAPSDFTLDITDPANGGEGGTADYIFSAMGVECGSTEPGLNACPAIATTGEGFTVTAHLGADQEAPAGWGTLAAKWSISLLVNGTPLTCVANSPENQCTAKLVTPTTEGSETVTGVLTTATGKTYDVALDLMYAPPHEGF